MLVLMKHSNSIRIAYKAPIDLICKICQGTIGKGSYYTRHQAPDPRHHDWHTGITPMIPYIACSLCIPYTSLEQNTGKLRLTTHAERSRERATVTEPNLPALRAKSARLSKYH